MHTAHTATTATATTLMPRRRRRPGRATMATGRCLRATLRNVRLADMGPMSRSLCTVFVIENRTRFNVASAAGRQIPTTRMMYICRARPITDRPAPSTTPGMGVGTRQFRGAAKQNRTTASMQPAPKILAPPRPGPSATSASISQYRARMLVIQVLIGILIRLASRRRTIGRHITGPQSRLRMRSRHPILMFPKAVTSNRNRVSCLASDNVYHVY
jgi:hypothetical protein